MHLFEMNYSILIFVACLAYAVIGNAVIYLIVKNKGIEISFIWSGTPGYLHKILLKHPDIFGNRMRIFSSTTIIAFVLVMLSVVIMGGAKQNA